MIDPPALALNATLSSEDVAERLAARRRSRDQALADEHAAARLALAALAIAAACTVAAIFDRIALRPSWTLLVSALVVILLTVRRQRRAAQRRRLDHAVGFWERAVRRLADSDPFEGRRRTADPNDVHRKATDAAHDYAADLDVFGAGSLFERTDDGITAWGQRRLEQILNGAHFAEPHDLQRAVRDLAAQWDFRERLAVRAAELEHFAPRHSIARRELDRHTEALPQWGREAHTAATSAPRVALDVLLAVLACGALTGAVLGIAPPIAAVLAWFVNLAWLSLTTHDLGALTARFEALERTLVPWSQLFEAAQSVPGTARSIADARGRLFAGSVSAAAAIGALQARVRRLSQRRNGAYALTVNVLLLLDTHARRSVLAWQRRHGAHLGDWFAAFAEIEALSSLAAYAAGVPGDAWPTFDPSGPRYAAVGLAHPLLPRATRVANDCVLPSDGTTWVVTGSNMSGKSTFLRAAGLSVVMARAGLPVAARSFAMRLGGVVTSMRVEDSLQGGASRFLSEVRRLRQCVDAAERPEGTLVLLDEILAGTNSKERHLGALAVLKSLGQQKAVVLLSTHDLGLAEIREEAPDRTRVVHFRDRVVNGEMIFDYVLRDGPLQTTNALRVMRREGLDVPVAPGERDDTDGSAPRDRQNCVP